MALDPTGKGPQDEGEGEGEDYLQGVLREYGIQLSPGGSSLVEIEEDPSTREEEEEEEEEEKKEEEKEEEEKKEEEETKPYYANAEKSRSGPRCPGDVIGTSLKDEEADGGGGGGEGASAKALRRRRKKAKLYQMGPLDDPEEERRRMNAVLAKRNRDMKKRKIGSLERQVVRLRRVGAQCRKVLLRAEADVRGLRRALEAAEASGAALARRLEAEERGARRLRQEALLLRGHLDLIGTSLDEDNPARRLLLALVGRLSPLKEEEEEEEGEELLRQRRRRKTRKESSSLPLSLP